MIRVGCLVGHRIHTDGRIVAYGHLGFSMVRRSFTRAVTLALACAAALGAGPGAVEGGDAVSVAVVAQEGEAPPGETDPIGNLGAPFVNSLGQVGFTGGLDTAEGTDSFVWFDDGITWKNSDADTNVLTGAEGTMGISDTGDFIYSPQTDGDDSVWTASGLLAVENTPAPGFPADVITTFHSRPQMLSSGRAHWVAGFNDTDGSGTDGRVLFTSVDGTPGQIEVVLRSDDVIEGFTIDRPNGIDFDYDFSDNGAHHIHTLFMDTGSSADDGLDRKSVV